jgi:hypothetical protein
MKTVIEMVEEAGINDWWDSGSECRDTFNQHLERLIQIACAEEREACAKVCDDHWNKSIDCGDKAGALQCVGIRTAIRARGQA